MRNLIIALILMVSTASCKKKKDEQIPTISISSPSAMTTFTYQEYISIKGIASDETFLKSIKVELFDNDLIATGIFNSKVATSNYLDKK